MMLELTHLSLFSGIGGLDLAAEWAGITTVGQCEYADYPIKVLEKHWPDVPRWRDIRTLTGDDFYVKTGRRTVDIVSGGFPCQPFSVAGKQKGKQDDRYLWPEMCRVIAEISPRWVVGENVPGILKIAAADVVQDLERLGYNVVVFAFEAAAVGAPHRRQRIAFVANAAKCGLQEMRETGEQDTADCGKGTIPAGGCAPVDDTLRGMRQRDNRRGKPQGLADGCKWAAEPDVGRVAHGVPARVDRIRCLGNAVVPQQFYPIFRAISIVETGGMTHSH